MCGAVKSADGPLEGALTKPEEGYQGESFTDNKLRQKDGIDEIQDDITVGSVE